MAIYVVALINKTYPSPSLLILLHCLLSGVSYLLSWYIPPPDFCVNPQPATNRIKGVELARPENARIRLLFGSDLFCA